MIPICHHALSFFKSLNQSIGKLAFAALSLTVFCPFSATAQETTSKKQVDFSTDIRPILADTCYKCHGPDEHEREANLRLDTKSGLFDESESIVPGELEASELYLRIVSDDKDTLMPPPDSGRVLTDEQKNLIKLWIEQGASWENHWSLEPVANPEPPVVTDKNWPKNPIDNFIAHRLSSENLKPSQQADRATLIRRVTFDLTGLPPSPELVNKYVDSQSDDWYETLVDELFASQHYGEHMARFWLDAARYGDTHGLHLDNYREMWPYRDWVVSAFNKNLSYKDFTIQQLAGDMLENPTDDQVIASGFNRAHVTTAEGGSIVEEVYVRNVVDRVSTTSTVFLGMTVACAQCHDHKFDPISQKEFYQLFAFFNNMEDEPMDKNIKNPAPVMQVLSADRKAKLAELEKSKSDAVKRLAELVAKIEYSDPADADVKTVDSEPPKPKNNKPVEFVWIEDDQIPLGAKKEQQWDFVTADKGPVNSGANSRVAESSGLIQHFFTGAASPLKAQNNDTLFAYVYLDPKNPPQQVMIQFNDGNWSHRAYWGENKIEWGQDQSPSRFYAGELPEIGKWVRLEVKAKNVGFKKLSLINGMAFTQFGGKAYWDSAGIVSKIDQSSEFKSLKKWIEMARQTKGNGLANNIKALVNKDPKKLGAPGKQKLKDYFLENIYPTTSKELAEPRKEVESSTKALADFLATVPTTLVSKEKTDIKTAFMLDRGEYDQKGDEVKRLTPAALPAFDKNMPANRLGFAQWLTSGTHPLTARVAVNRYWQQVFGTGIVKTSEDFGSQGDVPSHPELLDWLANDFVANDWDIRRLMKTMVMSATYRQSSVVTDELIDKDPENRLLARGPRYRLDAEMLRDQALAISDLLVPTIGGPSVKPPQPDGLWFAVGYSGSNTVRFKKDSGSEKVHRRSLYTFLKRTSPSPQMNTFDAPSREECRVRRERTNTPLQALLLMNDPQYVEAARHFAQLLVDQKMENKLPSDAEGIQFMYARAMSRSASDTELGIIEKNLNEQRDEFSAKKEEAQKLIAIGEMPADKKYDPVELASWTIVANLIMNMDEFVTKN
ncbi:MAG: PSD1 and planctomycete cytochrome C domain-containing protein [Mariniblastus sp.]